jgi:hypothetical protein
MLALCQVHFPLNILSIRRVNHLSFIPGDLQVFMV